MTSRLTLAAVAAAASLFFANDASAQAKSNIQDDPKSSSCTENCVDAGYEWAVANEPASDVECAASNADFAAGCAHWVEEQVELATQPLEEPVEAPLPADADPVPPAEGTEAPMPPDDSAAPPPEENQ